MPGPFQRDAGDHPHQQPGEEKGGSKERDHAEHPKADGGEPVDEKHDPQNDFPAGFEKSGHSGEMGVGPDGIKVGWDEHFFVPP